MSADHTTAVRNYLSECKLGTSEEVLCRVLHLSEYEVGDAIDKLVEQGIVRVVRRTRTSITYGLVKDCETRTDCETRAFAAGCRATRRRIALFLREEVSNLHSEWRALDGPVEDRPAWSEFLAQAVEKRTR